MYVEEIVPRDAGCCNPPLPSPVAVANRSMSEHLTCVSCQYVDVYEGAGAVCNGRAVPEASVVLFDAEDADGSRSFELTAGPEPVVAILFSGTKLREPIAWHGPIVMNTQAEIRQCFSELRSGTFPPKAVGWDYRRLDQFPSDHPARAGKHKA